MLSCVLSIYHSMEFSRQEYSSGLPFPPPGDLLNPGNELASKLLRLLHWQADSLPLSHHFISDVFGSYLCIYTYTCIHKIYVIEICMYICT